MCDKCGADNQNHIRGAQSPMMPKGWQAGNFLHFADGQDWREPSDFCPSCVRQYGTEIRSDDPLIVKALASRAAPSSEPPVVNTGDERAVFGDGEKE